MFQTNRRGSTLFISFCWVTPWQQEIQSWGKFCLTEPEPHHCHNKNVTLTLSRLFRVQPISPTPCRQIILEKPTVIQLVKKLPAFYRILKFIITFLRDMSQLDSVHILITCSIFIVVIFSHLCLGQPSCSFLWGCLVKILFIHFLPFTWECYMSTCF